MSPFDNGRLGKPFRPGTPASGADGVANVAAPEPVSRSEGTSGTPPANEAASLTRSQREAIGSLARHEFAQIAWSNIEFQRCLAEDDVWRSGDIRPGLLVQAEVARCACEAATELNIPIHDGNIGGVIRAALDMLPARPFMPESYLRELDTFRASFDADALEKASAMLNRTFDAEPALRAIPANQRVEFLIDPDHLQGLQAWFGMASNPCFLALYDASGSGTDQKNFSLHTAELWAAMLSSRTEPLTAEWLIALHDLADPAQPGFAVEGSHGFSLYTAEAAAEYREFLKRLNACGIAARFEPAEAQSFETTPEGETLTSYKSVMPPASREDMLRFLRLLVADFHAMSAQASTPEEHRAAIATLYDQLLKFHGFANANHRVAHLAQTRCLMDQGMEPSIVPVRQYGGSTVAGKARLLEQGQRKVASMKTGATLAQAPGD